MSARRGTSSVARLAAALGAVLLAGACASPAPAPRANLDPLYHGVTGEGEYDVDPRTAALAQRGPARSPPPEPPARSDVQQPCAHDWEQIGTHLFTDDSTGMPSLCAVNRCTKCGQVIHDCQRRWAR